MPVTISPVTPSASSAAIEPATRAPQSESTPAPPPDVRISIPAATTESPAIQRPVSSPREPVRDELDSEIGRDPRRASDDLSFSSMDERDSTDRPDVDGVEEGAVERVSQDRLTPQEQAQLRELQARDQEIRQRELARQVVGGQYTGQPNLSFERGPDGQRYAVSGDVPIDSAPVPDDAQATIEKMRVVRVAALASANPSPEDVRLALSAMQAMQEAQAQVRAERQQELSQSLEQASSGATERPLAVFREVAREGELSSATASGSRLDARA